MSYRTFSDQRCRSVASDAEAQELDGGCVLISHPRFGRAPDFGPGNGLLMPFGRYKGLPVESMSADCQYLEWLRVQPWFRREWPAHYDAVLRLIGGEGPSAA
jgi:hypothetical protein